MDEEIAAMKVIINRKLSTLGGKQNVMK